MGRPAYAEGGGSTGVAGLMQGVMVGLVDEVEPGVFESPEGSPVAPGERVHALDPEWREPRCLTEIPYPEAPPGTLGRDGSRRGLPVYEREDGEVVTERIVRLDVERDRTSGRVADPRATSGTSCRTGSATSYGSSARSAGTRRHPGVA